MWTLQAVVGCSRLLRPLWCLYIVAFVGTMLDGLCIAGKSHYYSYLVRLTLCSDVICILVDAELMPYRNLLQ